MELALTLVAIVAVVIVVAQLAERAGLQPPLTLLVVGLIASFIPGVPQIHLSPEVVLLGLLPPLLYAASLSTSLVDIKANRAAILSLALGLVLFTAGAVAVVVHAMVDVPWGVAIALGAVVAPPDAVAATAVARRVGLPRRVTTILEGESLLNDATALVTLRTALAAAGLTLGHGAENAHEAASVGAGDVAQSFALAVLGGVGIGVLTFLAIGAIRARVHETSADTALSFIAPFVAYLPAEEVGASGVLAVVTAGLLLAHKAPRLQTAASRLSERINWSSITFILENTVFLLIGLQVSSILRGVDQDELSVARTFAIGFAVLAVCLIARPVWVLPFAYLRGRLSGGGEGFFSPSAIIASWAGMRGVVTLAAVLTLPDNTPHRPALVMVALIVTVGTLALQGLTLPQLAKRIGALGPDAREDALQEATVIQATTTAGLQAIESDPASDAGTLELIRNQTTTRVNRVWERLGSAQNDGETPSESYRRMRLQMLQAERDKLLAIRDHGRVDQAVLTSVLYQMDAEEAALSFGTERAEALRESVLRTPDQISGGCEHLRDEPEIAIPATSEGCSRCLELGMTWVHLRLCTHCGNVGCCDSSEGKHASEHFRESGHPVMRSLEPGEAWRWCFVDEVLG